MDPSGHTGSNAGALLARALALAPRRYRLPPLPADPAAARAAGPDTALACALEAARRAGADEALPAWRELFTWALAGSIRDALRPQEGDAAFQARVLELQQPEVAEYLALGVQARSDARRVRAAVDAVAHPGKLNGLAPGPWRDTLAQLHARAAQADWGGLHRALVRDVAAADRLGGDPPAFAALAALPQGPELLRLQRWQALGECAAMQRHRTLRAQHGPVAGSADASAQGRAARRLGAASEAATLQGLQAVAALLDGLDGASARHRAVRGLRAPPGFPGTATHAKGEWDAALVRGDGGPAPVEVLLLAEAKASPAGATDDWPRLLRGLARLAQADAGTVYRFASTDGPVPMAGSTLQALAPVDGLPPSQVLYCCTAPTGAVAPALDPAARARLLNEPACLAFALSVAAGAAPAHEQLEPVWAALRRAPRLRAVLWQHETARLAREVMLHPDDLPPAVAQALRRGAGGASAA